MFPRFSAEPDDDGLVMEFEETVEIGPAEGDEESAVKDRGRL